jgi:hypothetical protein
MKPSLIAVKRRATLKLAKAAIKYAHHVVKRWGQPTETTVARAWTAGFFANRKFESAGFIRLHHELEKLAAGYSESIEKIQQLETDAEGARNRFNELERNSIAERQELILAARAVIDHYYRNSGLLVQAHTSTIEKLRSLLPKLS